MSRLYEGETVEHLCLYFPVVATVLKRYGIDIENYKKQTLASTCKNLRIDVRIVLFEIQMEQDIPRRA